MTADGGAPVGAAAADPTPAFETGLGAGLAARLERVTVRHPGHTALDGVSLAIEPGEALGLVGPSGAGKTTLLRLLNATVRPTAGSVSVDGRALAALGPAELRAVRARIGVVHQDLALVPNLRACQNVVAGALGRRSFLAAARAMLRPSRADLARAHALLERVGIEDKLFQRTDALSGGERQRVAIARALFQEPGALLADEPVAAVDPARARDTLALLVDLSRERGLTLVVSLHDLELARAFLPRLVGLRAGRVAFDAAPKDLSPTDFAALYALHAPALHAPALPDPSSDVERAPRAGGT